MLPDSRQATPSEVNNAQALKTGTTGDQEHHSQSVRPFHWRSLAWGVHIPAAFTALMGLVNLWSSIVPGLPARVALLWEYLPFDVRRGSRLTTVLAGFALLLLSLNLWRRKQVAWGLSLAVLVISIVAHLLKGLDYEEAICASLLVLWLWLARRQFHASSDASSVRKGLIVLVIAFVFTMAYGTLGFYLLDRHFKVNFDLTAALGQTVTMFTQFYNPGLEPVSGFGRDFAASVYIVAIATFGYALLMLVRPVVHRANATSEERARARQIVEAHGRSAMAFCTLFDDKAYWFSPGGSMISYAVAGRVAVGLSDPIGPAEDASAAVAGFVAYCEKNDWRPAFYEVYDEFLKYYRAAGLDILRIAHEAVLNVQDFSLAGKEGKGLRSAVNQITKAGYRARYHAPPLSDALLRELREVSDEWLAMMHGSEKQFSLGWFEDDYIRAGGVMAVHDPAGNVTAFANIVSCYNLNESTIDLMRRHPDTAKGTMELLFVSLFEWAKEQGFDTFNLGPSPFAMVGEHSEDPVAEKAIHFIYEHINQFYNFKGLHAFKEKFHPEWRPIYLAYSGKAGLPAVAASIIRADSGQNSWWNFLKHLRGEENDGGEASQSSYSESALKALDGAGHEYLPAAEFSAGGKGEEEVQIRAEQKRNGR
jgi:phosphatidylglycerol lysyltransferase